MKYLKMWFKIQMFTLYLLFILTVMIGGAMIGAKLLDVLGLYLSLLFTLPIVITTTKLVDDLSK